MSFLDAFKEQHEIAGEIVLSRDKEGRNAEVSVKDQFTVGDRTAAEFTMDIIEMKLKRARSYLAADNYFKFKEEMQDVSNYGIFCIVFETPTPVPKGGFGRVFTEKKPDPPNESIVSGGSSK